MHLLRLLLALAAHALLVGCATLAPRVPDAPSFAPDQVADTTLARIAAVGAPADAALSGFRMLPEGETAFNARIALARRAERSIDAQYYLIHSDQIGLQFLRELRDAAARGVRVRLLVDDLYTAGQDPLLTGLAAFANVEVRLFNPIASRATALHWRILGSLHEFSRINHRMHNKLFIADNSVSVSGGRNMADEYFMRSATANFVDLDVMATGPVVRAQSHAFDTYWNSPRVYPVAAVAASLPPEQARRVFDRLVQAAAPNVPERPLDILGQPPVAAQLDAGRLHQLFGPATVFADSPEKVAGIDRSRTESTVTSRTLAVFNAAQAEVAIVSPYFIPGEAGMQMIRAVGATDENGRLTLITNSLASTDEPLVHAGYARHRVEMLQAGVRIYELGSSLGHHPQRIGTFGTSLSRLHAKVALIDQRRIFIGSMNLDPRSTLANTEMGLVIDSAELAKVVSGLFRQRLSGSAYRLRLGADGQSIEWIETHEDGSRTVHTEEPGDSWWRRLQIRILSALIDPDLL